MTQAKKPVAPHPSLQKKGLRFVLLAEAEKKPVERGWASGEKTYAYDSDRLAQHLARGGNYGVACGFGDLVVVDADTKELAETVRARLPPTLEVATGSGRGTHFYFFCRLSKNIRLVAGDGKTNVGDIQGPGKQVVGPGCVHPSGGVYRVLADREIAVVSEEMMRAALNEYIKKDYLLVVKEAGSRAVGVARRLCLEDVLDFSGLKPAGHGEFFGANPVHGSTGGKNFWANPSKGVWTCFRCGSGGDALAWLAVREGLISCEQAVPGGLAGDAFRKAVALARDIVALRLGERSRASAQALERGLLVAPVAGAAASREELEAFFPRGHFVRKYLGFAGLLTDAYPELNLAGALSLLSACTHRRARVNVIPRKAWACLWFLAVGDSTVSRKTTALEIAASLAEKTRGVRVFSDEFSPEGWVAELAEAPRGVFFKDEFGAFLASLKKKYMAGAAETFCRMYDAPARYRRRLRKEVFSLEGVFLTVFGAMTPAVFGRSADLEDVDNGFFPRFFVVYPEGDKERKGFGAVPDEAEELEAELVVWLNRLSGFFLELEGLGAVLEFVPGEDAFKAFDAWSERRERWVACTERGRDLAPFFGRMEAGAWRLAALMEVGRRGWLESAAALLEEAKTRQAPGAGLVLRARLSKQSVENAIGLVEALFLPRALKFLDSLRAGEREGGVQKLAYLVRRYGGGGRGVDRRRLLQYSNMRARDFDECLDTLLQSGLLVGRKTETGALVYVLAEDAQTGGEGR